MKGLHKYSILDFSVVVVVVFHEYKFSHVTNMILSF